MKKTVLNSSAVWLCAVVCAAASAAPAPQQLQQVQKAIAGTQQQIRQTTNTQKEVDASLAQTRSKLQQANAQLADLARRRSVSAAKLREMQNRLDQMSTQIAGAQTQVARLLNAHYRNRSPNAVALLLKNGDVQQKGRLLQYMRYVSQANEQVIGRLHEQQRQLAQQQAAVRRQQAQLASLVSQQKSTLAQLKRQHAAQQNQSERLDGELAQQNAKLAKLKADEKRLGNLISRLSAQAAAKRKKAAAAAQAKRLAQQKRSQAAASGSPSKKAPTAQAAKQHTPPAATSTLTAEDLALRAPETAEQTEALGLAPWQGQMRRPVSSGHIAGQFGQSRPGGGTWKGLFFATAPAAVHSIAPGEVIYAGSLAGYGNTVIVDHGSGYVSVYTGLSAVSAHAGSHVAAQQTIGTSGRLPDGESGLYFEIRYRSQPLNPLSFVG